VEGGEGSLSFLSCWGHGFSVPPASVLRPGTRGTLAVCVCGVA